MTVKEIKVVLSLDDAGFSVKGKSAAEVVKNLELGLNGFTKSADKMETAVADLTKNVQTFGSGFKGLEGTLKAMLGQLQVASSSILRLAENSNAASANAKQLDGSLTPLSKSLSTVSKETETLAAKMAQAQTRMLASREGFAALDKAQTNSAAVAKKTSQEFSESRQAALRAEIESDDRIIAKRESTLLQLRKLEQELNNQALGREVMPARATQDPITGRMVSTKADQAVEADRLRQNATAAGIMAIDTQKSIDGMKQEQVQRRANLALIQEQAAAERTAAAQKAQLDQVASYAGKKNAEEIARIRRAALAESKTAQKEQERGAQDFARLKKTYVDQEVRDRREADAAVRQSARDTAAEQRRLAQETANEQKRQAESVAAIWKGIAQTYAATKIEAGLSKSVGVADQVERAKTQVSALNLPKSEEDALFASAETMSRQLKFISNLDAIHAKMSAIASIGYNNADIIDKTLATAVKASNNLDYLGYSHGDTQSNIRNMYGVAEMRQQTGSATEMNSTFELLQKIIAGTGGKVQTQDMETVLRRLGMGASRISDDGMINLASIVDQFKVAGGNQGGAGGGVSTVGTMIKMFQSYATGKGLSREAIKEFSGAGVLNDAGIDFSKDGAGVLSDAKHAGFKNADLWLKDPVAAMRTIMPKIIEYTQQEKNRGKFYEGRDINDVDAQMTAFTMYLARLGITTTAAQGAVVMGDPRSQERMAHQFGTIKNVKGVDALNDDKEANLGQQWTEVKAQATNIAELIGTSLLPPLKEALTVFQGIIKSTQEFGRNNPAAVQFMSIAAAAGGALLAVKGFKAMFGIVGPLTSAIAGLVSTSTGVSGAMTTASASTSLLTNAFGLGSVASKSWNISVGEAASNVAKSIPLYTQAATAASGIGTKLAATSPVFTTFGAGISSAASVAAGAGARMIAIASSIGSAFLRMIPIIGQLAMLYSLTDWIANLEVGGAKIIDWAFSWGDRFYDSVARVWDKVRSLFASEQGKLVIGAEQAAREAESKARRVAAGIDKSEPSWDQRRAWDAEDARLNADKAERERKAKEKLGNDPTPTVKLGDPNASAKIADALAKGGAKQPRPEHVDPLTRALEQAKGQVESHKAALESLKVGAQTVATIREEVVAELEGKRKAGDFNENHDKNKPVAADNAKYQALIEQTVQLRTLTEQKKALTFANERIAASSLEANDALERLDSGGTAKQTDAFRALSRELARAEERLGAGTTAFKEWQKAKSEALFEQSRAELGNFAADYVDKNAAAQAKLNGTESERIAAELEAAASAEDKKYQMRVDTLEKMRQATVAAILAEGDTNKNAAAEIADINKQALATREAADREYQTRVAIRAEENKRAQEMPIESLARQWSDTTKSLQTAQTSWANNFVDTLTSATMTGKLQFKSFALSVLADIAKIQMQKFAAGLVGMALNAFTGGAMSGGPQIGGTGAGPSAFGVQPGSNFGAVGSGFSSVGAVPFANGGIMTEIGPVALRKYANGGIANTPQLALYGEGSMREAYVPLPDGRTIPVTLKGEQGGGGSSGSPDVAISIVVNQGGEGGDGDKKSTKGDETGAWSKVADRIKDVVREELIGQQRPGGLLYK